MAMGPGKLSVTVEFAKDLKSVEWIGRQDPYCMVRLGNQSFRSKTARDAGTNPVWDQTFTFDVEDENDLVIDIKDDELLRDEPLGTATCSLSQVRMTGEDRVELPVMSRRTQRQHGIVSVALRWAPAGAYGAAYAGSYPAGTAAYGIPQAGVEYGSYGSYGYGGQKPQMQGWQQQPQMQYREAPPPPPSRVVEEYVEEVVRVPEEYPPGHHHHHHHRDEREHERERHREGVEEVIILERPGEGW